jgi:hypothetical protein
MVGQYAKAIGFRIVGVDIADDTLEPAAELGAGTAVNPATLDAVAGMHRHLRGTRRTEEHGVAARCRSRRRRACAGTGPTRARSAATGTVAAHTEALSQPRLQARPIEDKPMPSRKEVIKRIDAAIRRHRVDHGKGFRLHDHDPANTGRMGSEDKLEAKDMLARGVEWLAEQQDKL